ncbi:hypothetical protein B0H11DRAFT_1800083 [Mycena galericulata]|nr:hypothetical protein B0H11DRAFT_1800083 [Mycena galericulata]
MLAITLLTLLTAGASIAAPINKRDVTLDAAATAEAQVRDNTATRAFSAVPIKTSTGLCLSVDPNSGDFRENLTPVATVECNGSANQTWDVITAGVHNNVPGTALIVSSLTQACLNFDPRRAAGNQVLLFSCGGRADGGGSVTNSQQFIFNGGAGPLPFVPLSGNNATCLTANSQTKLVDQSSCSGFASASGAELFTIGAGGAAAAPPASPPAKTTAATKATTTAAATKATVATTTVAAVAAPPTTSTTLNAAAVAESQVRDNTATRAASAVAIKTSSGQCLSVNANAGDFRENLIPVDIAACDGSAGQQFDIITAGVHNNVPGTALFVSSLTQGCLNFDPRRAAGDQVILFSCGGRADGGGSVTNSQLFTFKSASAPFPLVPTNQANTCLFDNNGVLDQQTCTTTSPSATELFTI